MKGKYGRQNPGNIKLIKLLRSFVELSSIFNNITSPGRPHVYYRVPNTHTTLRLAIKDDPITPYNLCRTITYTQEELRAYIDANDATDKALAVADDPYQSSRRWTGCMFGVATVPEDAHHLTYGIVQDVLQGLFLYLFRGRIYKETIFQVFNDRFGIQRAVGIGKLTPGYLGLSWNGGSSTESEA
ncbi:hypothetical protein ACLMJK_001633 [Lecanora helva]